MVISLALLLARCCCIFVLLLSTANVSKDINAVVVAAAATSSSSNSRATHSYDGNKNENTDPCHLSHVAPRNGWTQTSMRAGGLTCEYHLPIARPDHEHLIQLNLSLGPLFDMQQTSGHRQQQQERTTPTYTTPTNAAILSNGNSAKTTFKSTPSSSYKNIKNNSDENITNRNQSDLEPPLTFGERTSSPSNAYGDSHSRPSPPVIPDSENKTKETNRTWDRHPFDKVAGHSEHDGGPNSNMYISAHLVNISRNYKNVGENGDNNSSDNVSKDISESSKELGKDMPSVREKSDFNHNKTFIRGTGSLCVLKLIVQGPHDNQPQKVCLRDISGEGLSDIIYYYRDALNITVTWDPRFGPALHLTYTMVPATGVKCSVRCNNSHLCLLESQLCDNHADCPDGADERRKECSLNRSSHHPNQALSTLKIVIIIAVVVLVILAACVCFFLRRRICQRNICTNRENLLRQQQRPHSHSSEMYRSPSGSMQDTSGTYDQREALLRDRHPQPSSTHSHPSSHTQSSPHAGLPNSYQHQPSILPSPSPCIRHNGLSHYFLSQDVSKPSSSRSPRTYPHHIDISRDGEEGYKASQYALHSNNQQNQNWHIQNEVFQAPPNKTIYDRDSPPPPYSFSAPTSTKSPELLVPGVRGLGMPRQVCTSNNNNNKHNSNMDNSKNQTSSQSANVLVGCQVSCPPHTASIYSPNRLSASGPPPDYRPVAATFSHRGHCPSGSSAALPNQGLPPNISLRLDIASPPSLKGPFTPAEPSQLFRPLSSLADSSNTFVVTNGSPSVCPGPDADAATHHPLGNEDSGCNCPKTFQENCALTTSWPRVTVPSSQLLTPQMESPLLSSSPCSTSSHVPVLPTPSLSSSPLSFTCQVDPGHHFASATSIVAPALENQAPTYCLNNNNNNNNNINNINDIHHHNNYNMNNNIGTGHCNNIISNGNDKNNDNNNDNNTYCNKINDVECVANNSEINSDGSPRLTISKTLPLPSTAPLACPSSTTSCDAITTTTPLSSLLPLSTHHHLQSHHHHLTHNQHARQTQPSWHKASHQVSLDATAQGSAPQLLPSPSPPAVITNSEYVHAPGGGSGLVPCSESNGNVFRGHEPSLPTFATLPTVIAQVLDPNGNNSEGPTTRETCELPSTSAQGFPGAVMMDPNENCDWSKSVKALSRSQLVSSLVNPCVDSTPCCDNTSAATTITATPSSSSSSSSLGMQPVNVSIGQTSVSSVEDRSRKHKQKEDATRENEEQDVVGVVVVTKSRCSPACTTAQERVE